MSARADGVKVLAFVLVTGVVLGLVGLTMGDFRFGDTRAYRAVFRDLSGLTEGAEVRAAGVRVGTVERVRLRRDTTVLVTFSVSPAVGLTTATEAAIRYKNLIGDRYLALEPGSAGPSGGSAAPLRDGGEIPMTRTSPALDLDELFNGFKPLLQGLDADQINQLSSSVIAVFQGQSATVNTLLANVASLTSTLADRDAVIGRLIDDLGAVLTTLDDHRAEFSDLIVRLRELLGGLARDRTRIGGSLEQINELAGTATGFLRTLRPELAGLIDQTGRLAAALNLEADQIDYFLGLMPEVRSVLGRQGGYGSFFNFYLCGIQIRLTGPTGRPLYLPSIRDTSTSRCSFPEGSR